MRRAIIVLGTSAAGLAALLSYKTHSLAAADPAPSAPAASAGPAQPVASGAGSSSASPAAGKADPQTGATPNAGASSQAATRTVTGTTANTQYGPMQVQLTLAGAKITKVTVLQRTDDGAESDEIDSNAIPRLTSETLAAQSARIDAVSGASYTSSGYIQSLQSALDQAGS
jgi:uncharacterized protein with FMN-binding domain